MAGLRCRYCQRVWPNDDDYSQCPVCRELTVYTQTDGMDEGEAREQAAHGDFGWWLYDHGRV